MSFNEFMVYFYAHIVNNTGLQACYVNIEYFVYSTFCVKYIREAVIYVLADFAR